MTGQGLTSGKGKEKETGNGEDLGCTNVLVMGPMTHFTLLTRGSSLNRQRLECSTYPGWGPEGTGPPLPCAGRGGKDDNNVAPLHTTKLAAYTNLLLNVMRSKHLLSHLILTLI